MTPLAKFFCFTGFAGSLFFNAPSVISQENAFQRYTLSPDADSVTYEHSQSFLAQNTGTPYDTYTTSANAKVEYQFATKHTVALSVPFAFAFTFDDDAEKKSRHSWGDIRASYEYMKRGKQTDVFFGPFVTIPVESIKDKKPGELQAGTGRFFAGAGLVFTGILDPVVWNIGLDYALGFPNGDSTWMPGVIQFSASISDLVNERFGFALGIYPRLSLPEIREGVFEKSTLSTLSYCRAEVFALFDKNYLRLSLDTFTHPQGQSPVFNIVYGHRFALRNSAH